MMIRTRHFAFQTGYQMEFDLEAGFTLALFARTGAGPRYRLIVTVGWNWRPTITYRDNVWSLNEPGHVRGLPIRRHTAPCGWRGNKVSFKSIRWERAARVNWYANE